MNKKILRTAIIIGSGLVIVICYLVFTSVISYLRLPNSKQIIDMARYIIYGICAVVVIITFLYAAIKVMGEMKFQKYVIDELNSFGFRENLHNDFVKRRDKYKGKNELVYLESINYLGIEKYYNQDFQGVLDNFADFNIAEFYEKHKLEKGKAQLNYLIVVCNMIDLTLTSYYKLGEMEEEADKLYPFLTKIHDIYITKYANLDATIIDSKLIYAMIKKNYAEVEVLLDLQRNKKDLVNKLANLTNSAEYEYVKGTLTIEKLDQMMANAEPLIAKTMTKEYYRHNFKCFYDNKVKALKESNLNTEI